MLRGFERLRSTQPANIASVRPRPALLLQKSAVIATLTSVKGRVYTSWELYPAPQLCSVASFSWLVALLFFPFLLLSSLPFLFHFPFLLLPFPLHSSACLWLFYVCYRFLLFCHFKGRSKGFTNFRQR